MNKKVLTISSPPRKSTNLGAGELVCRCKYRTPKAFDDLWMTSDGDVLTGLWFEGSRSQTKHRFDCREHDLPIFREVRRWLDVYFSGHQPDFTPPYRIDGFTRFRKEVVDAMLAIPFGETTTYGNIASAIAKRCGSGKMSARAVGGAVGWNPLCIIIPCHRVVGKADGLTGYGGGIRNKVHLLSLEGHDMSKFSMPAHGVALK